MEQTRSAGLPVVKEGRLVGVVSLGDVAVALSFKREVGVALERISESESTASLNDGRAIGTPRHASGLSR